MKHNFKFSKSSHMLRHSIERRHNEVLALDFYIIGNKYRHHTKRRNISAALFIKSKKSSLNKQDK